MAQVGGSKSLAAAVLLGITAVACGGGSSPPAGNATAPGADRTARTAALEGGAAGAVYHGSDAEPARRREVVLWIAQRLQVSPAQPRERGEPDAPPRPNRRVLSAKSRQALGVALRYPSYREGLDALLTPR